MRIHSGPGEGPPHTSFGPESVPGSLQCSSPRVTKSLSEGREAQAAASPGDTTQGLGGGEHRPGPSLGDFAPGGVGRIWSRLWSLQFWAWWCPRHRTGTAQGCR